MAVNPNSKQVRAPAKIVSCPYCNHKGSTRGLFTHVRLAHPGITSKPPISEKHHPYSLGSIPIKTAKTKRQQKFAEIRIMIEELKRILQREL